MVGELGVGGKGGKGKRKRGEVEQDVVTLVRHLMCDHIHTAPLCSLGGSVSSILQHGLLYHQKKGRRGRGGEEEEGMPFLSLVSFLGPYGVMDAIKAFCCHPLGYRAHVEVIKI